MLGPLLFDNRGAIVKIFCLQKKNFNSKKKSKKAFLAKKNLFTEHEFEKSCEAKKMHKSHITGRKKMSTRKIEDVAFI